MEEVLFISNEKFLDTTLPEGGVRLCTMDFIELLQAKYKVTTFGVTYNRSILFRLKFRLGMDAYEEYTPGNFHRQLKTYIVDKGIRKIFINLSNLSEFATYIKNTFRQYDVKVILCSHGNESGDFLHLSTRFVNDMPAIRKIFSTYRLGKILKKETIYRTNDIDCVLTVSEVEENIEKWLGAKSVYAVPRVFKEDFIDWKPVKGRIGFVGDVSHAPNYFGLLKLCEAFEKDGKPDGLDIRIVGNENANTAILKSRFSFVTVIGYMDNKDLVTEAGTWNYYLNLVFYYSKGVSTKLEKGINWGLPIMSTVAGNRGHVFNGAMIPTVKTPEEMASVLHDKLIDENVVRNDKAATVAVVKNTVTYQSIMNEVFPILETL